MPTPVTPDGRPDIGRFLQHCEWALANGCDGLNVLGTTGEATSLGPAMRREIMAAAAGALPRDKLMVGTGMPDLETTVALTRTAEELGFAAALVLPPFYYKGVSDEGLCRYYLALCEATADRPIPPIFIIIPRFRALPSRLA